ncbi:GspE/PulE family protein [Phenylobacterium sp.]|uniref:GspE/PulE family protein n=1 Tax=Phenylobacterium sp. TaxID=1871053 RepID=UPI002BAA7083|nr:GspE/PulE family protein [Phenylobacterium sp.]HLZ77180.1 GspE/PulE family protein [Phenylobacterium sp.]
MAAVGGLETGFGAAVRPRRDAVLQKLQDEAVVDASAIARAELIAAQTKQPVEQVLNQMGSLSDDDLVIAYADATGCQVWEPLQAPVERDLTLVGVSAEFLRRARVLPLRRDGGDLTCAACDPLDDEAFAGLVFATGCNLTILAARPAEWKREFEKAFAAPRDLKIAPDQRRLERELDLVTDSSADGSGARLVASAFEAAIALGASDIHFEPTRNDLRVRLRVDGRLFEHQVVSIDLAAPAVSRVKVIANLNLGERRMPQDGRTTFIVQGKQIDVRVATSPTVFGESAVLRILDRSSVPLDLDALGLSPHVSQVLRQAAKAAHGLFLVTGPTGSGKTTTLYALLETFRDSGKKVLSIEDPVEYHFEHVSQTQVAPHVGLTFAAALRSFLRQDPDVILVGEIRDPETAAVAVQAAMTGHFVLASVHANDAVGVIARLRDMGVEPYQLVAGFKGAVAQRLVRRLCKRCAEAAAPSDTERLFAESLGVGVPAQLKQPKGCPACKGTGFKGRIPIGEAFQADDVLLRALADHVSPLGIQEIAGRAGMKSMAEDGYDKALAGLTTLEEVATTLHG